MPIDVSEVIQDIPAVLAIVQKVQSGVAALPKPDASGKGGPQVTDYINLVASVLPDIGNLIKVIEAQAAS